MKRRNRSEETKDAPDSDDKYNKPKPNRKESTSASISGESKRSDSICSVSTLSMFTVIILGVAMVGFNTYELRTLRREQHEALEKLAEAQENWNMQPMVSESQDIRPKVQIWSPRVDMIHLTHVSKVFQRLGYKQATSPNDTDWDVLWAHDYPFTVWQSSLRNLKPHQKVNHFSGTGYVTTKVSLATSGGPYIPPAFKIPDDKEKLLEYVSSHPDSMFVEKSNDHRQVKLKALADLDFNSSGSFVQEFMAHPLLISGHKFDIGVYTIITSIDPLRIYKFDGDVLFRFCLKAYKPFNSSDTEQYVIGEDYLPAWKVPALQQLSEFAYSRKDAFDAYLRVNHKRPERIWSQIDDAISSVYLKKEKQFTDLLARYKSRRSFFEMVRFDFIVDEDLTVYMLEANMSPNLSSLHYPPNALLYEQVLYSLLSLVGVASYLHPRHPLESATQEMMAADLNVMVFPEQCLACNDCDSVLCKLCKPCISKSTLEDLKLAYNEHLNRQRCKRVYPPPMTLEEARKGLASPQHKGLTQNNQLMLLWFQGKCIRDISWCQ